MAAAWREQTREAAAQKWSGLWSPQRRWPSTTAAKAGRPSPRGVPALGDGAACGVSPLSAC
eukprot:11781018-Heterocapsa_arctica.AAC.1